MLMPLIPEQPLVHPPVRPQFCHTPGGSSRTFGLASGHGVPPASLCPVPRGFLATARSGAWIRSLKSLCDFEGRSKAGGTSEPSRRVQARHGGACQAVRREPPGVWLNNQG